MFFAIPPKRFHSFLLAKKCVWPRACQMDVSFSSLKRLTVNKFKSALYVFLISSISRKVEIWSFLPRDATHSAVMPQYIVRPSVCPCVTLRYRDHIGRNSWKLIPRPNSLRHLLGLTPTWAIWCNGNTPKIRAK